MRCLSGWYRIHRNRTRYQKFCVKSSHTASNTHDYGASSGQGPLQGLRILDLTRVLAGPYCSMIFGDMGADVIKVERPGVGDDTRSWGPPFCQSESSYFLSINRNKKLAVRSDVLIENYLPGKLAKMGLGYDQLSEIAPGLVYCSITGYGQTGPDASRAGYDVIVAATAGLTHITGPEDGAPCKVGVAMTDLSTGLYAYGAILSAILYRQKTGKGQHIDCNLLSTQVASLVNIASNYLNNNQEARRHGTAHQSIVPYQGFETKDGYIMAGAGNDKQFKTFCKYLGLDSLADNPDYKTNQDRVRNRKHLLQILSDRFRCKETSDWLTVLRQSGIPHGPINNMQQVFSDPQVLHNGLIQEMEHPTAGKVRVAGPAVRFSDSPTVLNHPPPTLGQHTEEVLRDVIGMDQSEITLLRSQGVVQ